MILSFEGRTPVVEGDAWVAPNATVLGDVVIGPRAGIWFGAVLRADVEKIRIGAETNIQDLCVLHVDSGGFPTLLGDTVTVGHRVVLHGCTVGDRTLVGMGSIVLNGAEIGADCILGAGSLVPPGMKSPSGVLALGSPAKVKRELTAEERASLLTSAANYVGYAKGYRK